MQKLFKNIIRSKPYSIFLDCLGVFCLSSFLLLWLYLGFVVEITPMCGFSDALIVFVDCKGYLGGALSFYFNLFSPMIIGIGMLSIYAIFSSLLGVVFIGVVLLVIIPAFRIIYKILQVLLVERKNFSRKNRIVMAGFGFLVILPSFLVTGLKFYLAPPIWSNRSIEIDLWHNEFVIPRSHLNKWSLVDVVRPDNIQGSSGLNFRNFGRRNTTPYFISRLPFNEVLRSENKNENIEFTIRPRSHIWSDNELFEQREKQLKKRVDKVYHKDKKLVYQSVKQENGWEVHEARVSVGGRKPDVYVLRDSNRNITYLLECTAKTYCEAYNYSKDRWKSSKCKNPEECMNCARRCTDSSGTNEYSLYYKLDKKYIREYADVRSSILSFVDEYKKSSRFVLSKENVGDWSEVNDGISIKMTEEAGRAFYVLTRNNVNKPLEFYIGDILLSAATVREPIGDGRMTFMLEGGIRDKAISFLEKE